MTSVSEDHKPLGLFLKRSGLELRGDRLLRTTQSRQIIEHRLDRITGVTFTTGNNLAVPGIGAVLLAVAGLLFYLIPISWLAWTILIATIAFVAFSMLGMRTPLLIFHEDGVRFRYPLIAPDDEVGAFKVALERAIARDS